MGMASTDALCPTVPSLHALAEHVLAAGLHAATGKIGLRAAPGGFATPESADEALGGRWAVTGTEVRISGPDGSQRSVAITTLRAAGGFFGIEPGMPDRVYTPVTPLDLDAVLPIDPAVAATIGDWLALGQEALTRLGATHPDDGPTAIQLWPEHFDLGSTLGEINFGFSPGDDAISHPYAYVGPWTPKEGSFWNQPFGATRTNGELTTVDQALAFFEEGRALALPG